jgi:ATP-dependent DNA helicase RecG
LNEKEGGFIVTLFKDKFSEEQLLRLGLNDRQIKTVLYAKERGKITNKDYQEINHISKRTAAYELVELVETYKIFQQRGESVGTYYEIL